MLKNFLGGIFLVLAATTAAGQSASRVDLTRADLECKPQYVTSADDRDPIVTIRLRLSDGSAQILHVSQSGLSFNRAEQYSIKSESWTQGAFTWSGQNKKNP